MLSEKLEEINYAVMELEKGGKENKLENISKLKKIFSNYVETKSLPFEAYFLHPLVSQLDDDYSFVETCKALSAAFRALKNVPASFLVSTLLRLCERGLQTHSKEISQAAQECLENIISIANLQQVIEALLLGETNFLSTRENIIHFLYKLLKSVPKEDTESNQIVNSVERYLLSKLDDKEFASKVFKEVTNRWPDRANVLNKTQSQIAGEYSKDENSAKINVENAKIVSPKEIDYLKKSNGGICETEGYRKIKRSKDRNILSDSGDLSMEEGDIVVNVSDFVTDFFKNHDSPYKIKSEEFVEEDVILENSNFNNVESESVTEQDVVIYDEIVARKSLKDIFKSEDEDVILYEEIDLPPLPLTKVSIREEISEVSEGEGDEILHTPRFYLRDWGEAKSSRSEADEAKSDLSDEESDKSEEDRYFIKQRITTPTLRNAYKQNVRKCKSLKLRETNTYRQRKEEEMNKRFNARPPKPLPRNFRRSESEADKQQPIRTSSVKRLDKEPVKVLKEQEQDQDKTQEKEQDKAQEEQSSENIFLLSSSPPSRRKIQTQKKKSRQIKKYINAKKRITDPKYCNKENTNSSFAMVATRPRGLKRTSVVDPFDANESLCLRVKRLKL